MPVEVPIEARGIGPSEAGVTGGCHLPNVDASYCSFLELYVAQAGPKFFILLPWSFCLDSLLWEGMPVEEEVKKW